MHKKHLKYKKFSLFVPKINSFLLLCIILKEETVFNFTVYFETIHIVTKLEVFKPSLLAI